MDRYFRKRFKLIQSAVLGLIYCMMTMSMPARAADHPLSFSDVALEAGFQDRLGHGRALVAADFDGNGWDDFYIGNPTDESFILWNDGPDKSGNFKFRKGQILFTSERAFIGTAADYDNDGDADLYIGVGGQEGAGLDYLFRNDKGVFIDVSETAGIKGPINPANGEWVPLATSSGTFADYDKDGDLDLFVAARITPAQEVFPGSRPPTLVLPNDLGWRDTLFSNNGDGTFTDVTEQSGIRGIKSSMTAAWGDYDNDGWVDLIIPYSNFETVEFIPEDNGYLLYQNNQDGTFTEVPFDMAALGINDPILWATSVADFNNDGLLDILGFGSCCPTDFLRTPNDSHSLLINQGNWTFKNEAISSGLATPGERPPRVMGCQIGDVDSNGYPDVIMATGAPLTGDFDILLLNNYTEQHGIRFNDVSSAIDFPALDDPACTDPTVCFPPYPYRGHAVVVVDYDKDGDMDIPMIKGGTAVALPFVPSVEPNRLFRNEAMGPKKGLFIELHGLVSNHDAVGARIEVTVEENDKHRKIYKEVKAGSCFSASGPREVHIGLGDADEIEELKITWPSGVQTLLDDIDMNQRIKIHEEAMYSHDFNRGSAAGWRALGGKWAVENGEYIQKSTGPALTISKHEAQEDFSVAGKLTYLSGEKQISLLGRASRDGQRYYAAVLRDNQAWIYKHVKGKTMAISQPITIEPMTAGKSYVVRLTFEDAMIQMEIDGQTISAMDSSIEKGVIGFATMGTAASIDNVIVYSNEDEMEHVMAEK